MLFSFKERSNTFLHCACLCTLSPNKGSNWEDDVDDDNNDCDGDRVHCLLVEE